MSVLASCPTALSFGDLGEITSRVMMLRSPRHSGPCGEAGRKEGRRETEEERVEKSLAVQRQQEKMRGSVDAAAPGGPMSAAPSVTVEPMGLCEETLSLLSRTLQPLHRNNELTGCCVSYTSACVLLCVSVSAYWVRRRLGLVLEWMGRRC